ncbi:hypothetical protein FV242_09955 [Methylobacterium sp. WL64]|nr:hypothetical protein FV242_09955 [Methylobacterium sp. WL64]
MIRKLITAFVLPKVIAYVSRRLGRWSSADESSGLLTFPSLSNPLQDTIHDEADPRPRRHRRRHLGRPAGLCGTALRRARRSAGSR